MHDIRIGKLYEMYSHAKLQVYGDYPSCRAFQSHSTEKEVGEILKYETFMILEHDVKNGYVKVLTKDTVGWLCVLGLNLQLCDEDE